MRFPIERFLGFASRLRIPSKEAGSVPLVPMGTQRYFIDEVARGLEEGVHYFVTLKGRQQGFSTIHCALDLFWNLDHEAMQGLIITDSDDNHAYFRDIIAEMLGTVPNDYRLPVVVNNDDILRFGTRADGFGGSRLMYQVAGVSRRKRAKLGRGRGVNFLHGDELGYWTEKRIIGGLNRSLASEHPRRFYSLGGTANGAGLLKDQCDAAKKAITRRFIFVGWWRNEKNAISPASLDPKARELFAAYGVSDPTEDERLWIAGIRDAYGVSITEEQLAWYRYQLEEEFEGDEDMRAQEEPCLPEDAFVIFGEKFIKPGTIRRLRKATERLDRDSYRYEWAAHIDHVECVGAAPGAATLTVWQQPQPGGAYLIGAKPADEFSDEGAIVVFRIYPDRMDQVAEYVSKGDTTYQFTWALCHLAGNYSMICDAFLALELAGNGEVVLREMDNLKNFGWGLSQSRRSDQRLRDVLSGVREYLYRRADSFSKRMARHWKTNDALRAMLFQGLRDCIERGVMRPTSGPLVESLAALRSGAESSSAPSGALAHAAACAARHFMDYAVGEIVDLIPRAEAMETDPGHVGEFQVQQLIARTLRERPKTIANPRPFWRR